MSPDTDTPEAEDTPEVETDRVPEWHNSPDEVEAMDVSYSTRGPGDWVLSGPLGGHGSGPGRRFATVKQAEDHARALHPGRVAGRITEATLFGGNRWAFLIKGKHVGSNEAK